MNPRRMCAALLLFSLLLPALAHAQPMRAQLAAASALVHDTLEVRLRLRIESGWMPAEGIRVYREVGGRRALIHRSRTLTDTDADRALDPAMRRKNLWTKAARSMTAPRSIDFRVLRPPSAAPRFGELKLASERLLQLHARPATDPGRTGAITTQLRQVETLRRAPLPRLALRTGFQPVTALGAADRETFTARSKLMLTALVEPDGARTLGLGMTDRGVRHGDVVRYSVVAVQAGADGPVIATTEHIAGAVLVPPAPTGLKAFQRVDDDGDPAGAVEMRWDRLAADVEAGLLNAAYRIERRVGQSAVAPRIGALPTPGLRDLKGGSNPWHSVHRKPVMIAAVDGLEEPVSFFSDDSLTAPGVHTYRVALLDGFGRMSEWSELVVTLADWRRPDVPGAPAGTLDPKVRDAAGRAMTPTKGEGPTFGLQRVQPQPMDLRPWSELMIAGGRASVTVSWIPVAAPPGLTARYRVFRANVEAPDAAPRLLTPEPIDGRAVAPSAEQVAAQARIAVLEAELAVARAQLRTAATAALRGQIEAKTAESRTLRLIAAPRRGFDDVAVPVDARYRYLVRAVFVETGLESGDGPTAIVPVPSPAQPPAVQGLRSTGFTPSHRLASTEIVSEISDPAFERAVRAGARRLARVAPPATAYRALAPSAAGRFSTSQLLRGVPGTKSIAPKPGATPSTATTATTQSSTSTKPLSTSLSAPGTIQPPSIGAPQLALPGDLGRRGVLPRTPVFSLPDRSKLRMNLLRGRDDGGVVTLTWTAVPQMKNAVYTVQRRSGNLPYTDVGTTAPDQTQFRDVVPRSMERVYTYRVIATSRWGVQGRAGLPVTVTVPSTLTPGRPNVLAAAPDPATDLAILLRVDPNPREESVVRYQVLRDGTPVGTITPAAADTVQLTYRDRTGLAPGRTYAYTVVAETAGGLRSEPSPARSAKALRTVAAAPSGLQGAADARGVNLTWNAAPEAASYAVQRRGPGGARLILAGGLGASVRSFLDVAALRGATYTYEVVATDVHGNVSPAASFGITVP